MNDSKLFIFQWVTQGTELFNQKPERGIEFLQEHGVLPTPLDPHQVALFLRENPDLDKKMIGEYNLWVLEQKILILVRFVPDKSDFLCLVLVTFSVLQ